MSRSLPRVSIEALCTEFDGHRERHAMVVDLSAGGLRVERPYLGGPTARVVQLEVELPGIDEIVWAKGEVCFDRIRPAREHGALLRTSGIRLAAAAARDLRLLRDYVTEMRRGLIASTQDWLARATGFVLG